MSLSVFRSCERKEQGLLRAALPGICWLPVVLPVTFVTSCRHAKDDCAAGDGFGSTETYDADNERITKDADKNPAERFAAHPAVVFPGLV